MSACPLCSGTRTVITRGRDWPTGSGVPTVCPWCPEPAPVGGAVTQRSAAGADEPGGGGIGASADDRRPPVDLAAPDLTLVGAVQPSMFGGAP